jgi:hypothetical protein
MDDVPSLTILQPTPGWQRKDDVGRHAPDRPTNAAFNRKEFKHISYRIWGPNTEELHDREQDQIS